MVSHIRHFINLVEKWGPEDDAKDAEEFQTDAVEHMSSGHDGKSFWIDDKGVSDWVPPYGQHDDIAYQMFGGDDHELDVDKEDDQMMSDYGHLFPNENREYLSYRDIAMAHGWIRIMLAAHSKILYINLIKGRPTTAAKRVLATLIQNIESHVQQYVIEYNTGSDTAETNFAVTDARKALSLVNAR